MCNSELKFELGKWYYFKDEASEAEFRNRFAHNETLANIIINAERFRPTEIEGGHVYQVELAYGGRPTYMTLQRSERKFFTEMVVVDSEDEWAEDGFSEDEDQSEDAAPSEPSDFPLTKITISNNSEAWTVYQMLKAHFKE